MRLRGVDLDYLSIASRRKIPMLYISLSIEVVTRNGMIAIESTGYNALMREGHLQRL